MARLCWRVGFGRHDQADTQDDHANGKDRAPSDGFAIEQPAKDHGHDRIDVGEGRGDRGRDRLGQIAEGGEAADGDYDEPEEPYQGHHRNRREIDAAQVTEDDGEERGAPPVISSRPAAKRGSSGNPTPPPAPFGTEKQPTQPRQS